MSLRNLIAIRRIATSTIVRAAILSSGYRSSELWIERFQCPIVCNNDNIRAINNKILAGNPLSNLELDIFINVARPSTEDKAQVQEAAKLLLEFRKSLIAHRLLPSTPHAVCRLFLDSECITSLVTLLENRVKFGIFPDFFSTNLMLDSAIDSGNYALASKIASLVMLQEEFGVNRITDKLSLLSLVQYIDSKTDFQDWPQCDCTQDLVLQYNPDSGPPRLENQAEREKKEEVQEEVDEEDEEDAEYIRIPFLRNPYSDNHFDCKNPRILCGKSLSELGRSLSGLSPELSIRAELLGKILQGLWDKASALAKTCKSSKIKMGPTKEILQHYLENLHELETPSDEQKKQLSRDLEALSDEGPSFLELAKKECVDLGEYETKDIGELKSNLKEWSQMREKSKQAENYSIRRDQLVAKIEAKKQELQRKEDYLYFYDRLKTSKLTRIEYI